MQLRELGSLRRGLGKSGSVSGLAASALGSGKGTVAVAIQASTCRKSGRDAARGNVTYRDVPYTHLPC